MKFTRIFSNIIRTDYTSLQPGAKATLSSSGRVQVEIGPPRPQAPILTLPRTLALVGASPGQGAAVKEAKTYDGGQRRAPHYGPLEAVHRLSSSVRNALPGFGLMRGPLM